MKNLVLMIMLIVSGFVEGCFSLSAQNLDVPFYQLIPDSADNAALAEAAFNSLVLNKPWKMITRSTAFSPNADFEQGDFFGWTCAAGTISQDAPYNITWRASGAPSPTQHQIISASSLPVLDRYGNFSRLCPYGGAYSVQLGNNATNRGAEKISYQFTIPPNDNDFTLRYYYAAVMQVPSHSDEERPRLRSFLYDLDNDSALIACGCFDYTASKNLSGFVVNGSLVYRDWTTVTVNLSGHAGHKIMLEFVNNDCTHGAHFGYAYIDVASESSTMHKTINFCSNSKDSVLLVAPPGYAKYNWYKKNDATLLSTNDSLFAKSPILTDNDQIFVDMESYAGVDCRDTAIFDLKEFSVSSVRKDSICSSSLPYNWEGQSIDSTGIYTKKIKNVLGCDSTSTLDLKVFPSPSSILHDTICSPQVYHWNGQDYNSEGVYTKRISRSTGCDSTAILDLKVSTPYDSLLHRTICSGDSCEFKGKFYNKSGSYSVKSLNVMGCDSISTLVLTVNPLGQVNRPSDIRTCNKSVMDSIVFSTVNTSGKTSYYWTSTNNFIGLPVNGTGNITSCTIQNNGRSPLIDTITVVPTFTANGVSCTGSPEQFRVIGYPDPQVDKPLDATLCNNSTAAVKFTTSNKGVETNYSWTNDNPNIGLPAQGTGDISFVAKNASSKPIVANIVVTPSFSGLVPANLGTSEKFTITVNNSSDYSFTYRICQGESYKYNGNTYNSQGSYVSHYTNSLGCDSTVTLNLIVSPTYNLDVNHTVCYSDLPYIWEKQSCPSANDYKASYKTVFGCDSLITLHLTVNKPTTSLVYDTICESKLPLVWNDISCNEAKTYTATLKSFSGCDSLASLALTVNTNKSAEVYVRIFSGEKYIVNENEYSAEGTYKEILHSSGNCDSVLIVHLSYIDIPNTITPNGDGINDVFMPDWHLKIFNRNGILMYDGTAGWDGTNDDKPVQKGTYFYVLYYVSENKNKSKEGYVTVVR